jgi:hypothetical protein
MPAHHILTSAILALAAPVLVPGCVATVDSTMPNPDEPTANMTPSGEPVAEPTGEVSQELQFCECSIESDWCILKGKICRPGVIPCTKTPASCGTFGNKPCVGWCLD